MMPQAGYRRVEVREGGVAPRYGLGWREQTLADHQPVLVQDLRHPSDVCVSRDRSERC